MCVLRAEIVTIFEPKMVTISTRNTNIYLQNLKTLQGSIFQALYHFATKLYNFTNFIMFFLAAVFDSLLFTKACSKRRILHAPNAFKTMDNEAYISADYLYI
jgi:hypothetical protein